jgi:hypothetical protein
MARASWSFASLLALALAIAACSGGRGGGPPTFSGTFPAQPDIELGEMPVSLVDQTGFVTGLEVAAPTAGGSGTTGVSAVPGTADAVRVDWLGDGCDGHVTLVLIDAGNTYEVGIHIDPTPAGGLVCPAVEVARAVTIKLREPIEPQRFSVSRKYP